MLGTLQDADGVRRTDSAAAIAIYAQRRFDIDPLDADRIGWLAAQRGPEVAVFLDHFEHAAQYGHDELAVACTEAIFALVPDLGDLQQAERDSTPGDPTLAEAPLVPARTRG